MRICGTVIKGEGRGRELSFPTANIEVETGTIPEAGIYAGKVSINTVTYRTAIHIGPRPTFNDMRPTVEAHILDFSGDLYDTILCLDLIQKLRDIEHFDTIELLQTAIENDCKAVRELIAL